MEELEERLTPTALLEWLAYFQVKAEETEKAQKKAEAQAKAGARR